MMKCEKCNYKWKPRKDKPRQCPKCKRYDYDGERNKKREKLLNKKTFKPLLEVKNVR